MTHATKIEWCHAPGYRGETWNPIRGCSRVSRGCENCYAERQAARFSGPGLPYHGLARATASGPRWTGKVRLVAEKLAEPLKWRKPRMVFVNSMSDLFHESLHDLDIAAVFGAMEMEPAHRFLVLTKRPQRMLEWCRSISDRTVSEGYCAGVFAGRLGPPFRPSPLLWPGWPLPHVWLGVSVEDQATADERIPLLLQCPAAVRWISAEPLLGPVDLDPGWMTTETCICPACADIECGCGSLDWVVVGGESGPGARSCDMAWVRSIVVQCRDAGVPAFVKQLGARPTIGGSYRRASVPSRGRVPWPSDRKGGDIAEFPADLRVREWPK